MRDITPLMDAYRECMRHVWNTYFQADAARGMDWDLRDEFNLVALSLFRALVLRKIGHEDAEVQPDQWAPREPLLFLHLVVEPRAQIMINRDRDSGHWDHPLRSVETGDLDLRYLEFFDWSEMDFRDFAFYRARVVASETYPDTVGRDALVPVGTNVRVLSESAAERPDAPDERALSASPPARR